MSNHIDMFWGLIEASREGVKDLDDQMEKLHGLLMGIEEDEILQFHRAFEDTVRAAYRWDLWGAAHIINDGCSDDGFDRFLGWLISRGRKFFDRALSNPERAGDGVQPGQVVECEEIWYAASRAYEEKTAKSDFFEVVEESSRTIRGQEWEEEEVYDLFPNLAKKFKR